MSETERALLSELLEWYSLQRHDILNHLQVIMGNLQLDQPGKALAYIRNTVSGFSEEQKIAQIPVPQLEAILMGFLIRLRQEDVLSTIDFPAEMKREEFWKKHWREEYIEALYGYTRNCINELAGDSVERSSPLNAEVYLYDEPGGLSCQFILSDEESVLMDKVVKLSINNILDSGEVYAPES